MAVMGLLCRGHLDGGLHLPRPLLVDRGYRVSLGLDNDPTGGVSIGYQRRTGDACVVGGRDDRGEGSTAPERSARWGRWPAYTAMVVPLLYAATRLAWAFGVPLGISAEFFREGQEVGLWQLGGVLGGMAVLGAVLTLGLVRPWGEVFPRWLPWIGGRRVPLALAFIPAALISLLVTSAGLMFLRIVLFGTFTLGDFDIGLDENWAAIAPELFWPVWGVALGAATAGYYFRRRGICRICGRVGDSRHRGARSPAMPSPPLAWNVQAKGASMSGELAFVEFGVEDVERGRVFYESLFGWKFENGPSGQGFAVSLPNVSGGMHGSDRGAAPYTFFRVDDIDAAAAKVEELGGSVDDIDVEGDDESRARFGRFRLCKDDQGSPFGLHQPPLPM